jgi:hypothetical protein
MRFLFLIDPINLLCYRLMKHEANLSIIGPLLGTYSVLNTLICIFIHSKALETACS